MCQTRKTFIGKKGLLFQNNIGILIKCVFHNYICIPHKDSDGENIGENTHLRGKQE